MSASTVTTYPILLHPDLTVPLARELLKKSKDPRMIRASTFARAWTLFLYAGHPNGARESDVRVLHYHPNDFAVGIVEPTHEVWALSASEEGAILARIGICDPEGFRAS